MTETDTPPVEVETGPSPASSIIWLHGLGADGHDFEPLVPELGSSSVRFVFPHAPYRPVSINSGYVMRAWYDLGMDPAGYTQNSDHLREAIEAVTKLVQREQDRGIPSHRILLAGFSQGGVVVLHAGLGSIKPLAGMLVLSAPVVDPEGLLSLGSVAGRQQPVFLAYGTEDSMVPLSTGLNLRDRLVQAGIPVDWHTYPMGHTVSREEISDIRDWIGRIFDS